MKRKLFVLLTMAIVMTCSACATQHVSIFRNNDFIEMGENLDKELRNLSPKEQTEAQKIIERINADVLAKDAENDNCTQNN